MSATVSTSMSATTMLSRRFVRAQRRWQNGNTKVLEKTLLSWRALHLGITQIAIGLSIQAPSHLYLSMYLHKCCYGGWSGHNAGTTQQKARLGGRYADLSKPKYNWTHQHQHKYKYLYNKKTYMLTYQNVTSTATRELNNKPRLSVLTLNVFFVFCCLIV